MVDFAKETVVDVRGVCERFRVTHDTVYRWFKRGLEWAKVGGKVVTSLEAINRFSRQSGSSGTTVTPVYLDRDTLAAIKSLKARGINVGMESNTDGRSKAKAEVQHAGL